MPEARHVENVATVVVVEEEAAATVAGVRRGWTSKPIPLLVVTESL